MKNIVKIFIPLCLLILLNACRAKKAFKTAIEQSTISHYENYVTKYPKHKNVEEANATLIDLYEERDWNSAKSGKIYQLNTFIRKYPESKYLNEAKNRLSELEQEDDWGYAKSENTINSYTRFITQYPQSRYKYRANSAIKEVKEKNDWSTAKYSNTSDAYRLYLDNYPYGKFGNDAKEAIRDIEVIRPAWDRAKTLNTILGYTEFLRNHRNCSYKSEAMSKIKKIEESHWVKTQNINSIKAYKNFVLRYPQSRYVSIASKNIIDLEVDAIFKGDHGKLPPMSKTNGSSSTITTVKVKNDTEFTLTVRYSGEDSKKIILPPRSSKTAVLTNGAYRLTASVDAANVSNYAGKEVLKGGEYDSSFYIETTNY